MPSRGSGRWWALTALALSIGAVGLDGTILNTALPTVSTALHASTSQLQWFVDSYNLVMAAILLPAGLLGDRLGRKKMILLALLTFGVGSVWCAFSQSPASLIAARAVLGLGAAFLVPLCMSVLLVLFEPDERRRAVAVMTGANMIGFPLGPILGGVLLKHFWWGSVFLTNVPVVLIGMIIVGLLVPESRNPRRSRLDLVGVALAAIGMVAITFAVIEAGERGWGDRHPVGLLLAGLTVMAVFVLWERQVACSHEPLVQLSLFRSRGFVWGTILATVVSFAMFGLLFNTPQYFQAVLGTDSLGTGLRLLPMVAGLIAGVRVANRWVGRSGPRAPVAAGFAAMAAGLLTGTTTTIDTSYGFTACWLLIFGIGLGMTMSTTTMAALGALSKERGGVGSALIMVLRQLGSAIGVALLGSLANAGYRSHLGSNGLAGKEVETARESVFAGVAAAHNSGSGELLQAVRLAFVHGMDITLWACGGIAALGLILTLLFLTGPGDTTQHHAPAATDVAHRASR